MLGVAILFVMSTNCSREVLLVYSLALTISMYFYDVYTEQTVNFPKKLILTGVFVTVGVFINFSGMIISTGVLHMYSGGILISYIAIIITYISVIKRKKMETIAGILIGMTFYSVFDIIYNYTSLFTLESTFYIFTAGLLIFSRIYTGKLYNERTEYFSAAIFVALPLMFLSSVPMNFSSCFLLGAYKNSNIITGGYNSISSDHFRRLFSLYFYISTVIAVLISIIYVFTSKKLNNLRRYVPVRFGRTVIIVIALTCMQSLGNGFLEISLTALLGLCGFVLYKYDIFPETVFMGYVFNSVIQNESLKIGILSSETGLAGYISSIPKIGVAAIIFIIAASYFAGKYALKYDSSQHH